jgi:hypothetical protein
MDFVITTYLSRLERYSFESPTPLVAQVLFPKDVKKPNIVKSLPNAYTTLPKP